MSELIVKVGKFPGRISEVVLREGASVTDVLTVAELDSSGYEIRMNGSSVDLTAKVEDGDAILLVKKN